MQCMEKFVHSGKQAMPARGHHRHRVMTRGDGKGKEIQIGAGVALAVGLVIVEQPVLLV